MRARTGEADPAGPRPRKRRSVGKIIAVACGAAALLSVGLPLALRAYGIEAFKIPAGSMYPTLEVGDHVFVDKTSYTPRRGDVVVFIYPRDESKDFIKRIVALGGDTIAVRDNRIILNGQPVPRRALGGRCLLPPDEGDPGAGGRGCAAFEERLGDGRYEVVQEPAGFTQDRAPLKIPPGHAFMMGDNRDNSHDSRFWGTVPYELIMGRAGLIWFSSGPDGIRWDRLGLKVHDQPGRFAGRDETTARGGHAGGGR